MAEPTPLRQPRRAFLRGAALTLTIALAACVGPRRAPPEPVAPPPPEPTRPVTGNLPTDTERHRVALLAPITGPNAAVGQSLANAANLALLDAGGKGIRITTYDTAPGAVAAARRALADGNRLFLGPLLGDDVKAVAPIAAAARVPVFTYSNDVSAAGPGVYLLGYTPNGSIERVVDYAAARGLRRFAGLMPSGVYGRRASGTFLRAVQDADGTVVAMADYDRSPQSLSAAIRKLQAAGGYDALMIADSGRIVLQAAPQVRKAGGASARILGTELWNTETALAASPALSGAWFAAVPDGLYRQFAAKYRARFGRGPYRLATLGYDSVLLTMRIAGNWKLGEPFPQAMLTDRDGFAGIDGAFRFGRDGIAERTLEVKQIGPGGVTVVSPAARGFGRE